MRTSYRLIFLICLFRSSSNREPYDAYPYWNARHQVYRIKDLMYIYHEEALKRNALLDFIKYTYEPYSEYEQGFIMGELIERYRKLVEVVRRPWEFKSDPVFETLKATELAQNLYFEIYHLVNMLHEVPRKYGKHLENPDTNWDPSYITDAQKNLKAQEERRRKERKKRMKILAKIRDRILSGNIAFDSSGAVHYATKKSQFKWWPIEYGWEIDYYW